MGLRIVYTVLAVIPILAVLIGAEPLLVNLSLIECIGVRRNGKTEMDVLREAKVAHIVRAFLVLEQMHRFAVEGFQPVKNKKTTELDAVNVQVISRIFDAFDSDGSGSISMAELTSMMVNFGASAGSDGLKLLYDSLDVDGDGDVEKHEFVRWYGAHVGHRELTLKQRAGYLFGLFDQDGDGTISIGEIKKILDQLKAGFTIDEITDIVSELDENGDNTIGLEEFEELVHRFYPQEFRDD